MSDEYPSTQIPINGNGSEPDSDPDPINRWDIRAIEELLTTVVSKQVAMEGQVDEVERQVLTLRQIVENSINVQLQDRQEILNKLNLLLANLLKTIPIVD